MVLAASPVAVLMLVFVKYVLLEEDSLIHVNLASLALFHRARCRQWLKMALQLFRMVTTLFAWQADGEKICMNLYGLILLLKPPPDKPNLLSHEMLGSVPVELALSLWCRRVDYYNKKRVSAGL